MASAANDREKALEAALAQIERQFGKGSVMRLGEEDRAAIEVIPTGSIALDTAPPLIRRKNPPLEGVNMLTAQKRKYALALMSGMSQKDAAIKAGYSEKSARSKGSQLAKDPEVIAFIERKKREKVEVDDEPQHRRNVYTPAVNTAAEKPPPVAPSASQSEAA